MYEVIKNLRSNPLEVHNLAKWFTFFVRYRECGCVGERERERASLKRDRLLVRMKEIRNCF